MNSMGGIQMFDNKAGIIRECERRNANRRVFKGAVDHKTFFQKIKGDLLVSGYIAGNMTLLADMIDEYIKREDFPTIVLSNHKSLFDIFRYKQRTGEIHNIVISDSEERNYHPFYGMSKQQVLYFIRITAEELGYNVLIDQLLQYASSLLNIIEVSYPVSLPAMTKLLQNDDDAISAYALQKGLSNVIADNICAHHEAGIILRRVCEKLEDIFENISAIGEDTQYNFQSGVHKKTAAMLFYAFSSDQKIMNSYLKEELFCVLKQISKIRVIADELDFENGIEDELLNYLLKMKRQGKIELIYISKNAGESINGMHLNFSNIILSLHDEPAVMEEMSKMFWGTYSYHYPTPTSVKPPAFFPTVKTAVHWTIAVHERLRVRAEDLYARQGIFLRGSDLLAVKTTANNNIYLVDSSIFLPKSNLPSTQEVFKIK